MILMAIMCITLFKRAIFVVFYIFVDINIRAIDYIVRSTPYS
jgi:hypothetical protein